MPYGFISYIENKGYSDETVKSYDRVVSQFFSYIKKSYPMNKEPFQISAADINNYLEEQLEKEKTISTVNKELAIIKTMFNYFWESEHVPLPVDPTVKIKRIATNEHPVLDVSYDTLMELLKKVLDDPNYPAVRKAIFLLAIKGLKTSDFRFKKSDVYDSIDKENLRIILRNREINLEAPNSSYFYEYFNASLFNGSEYVFVTKPRGEDHCIPIQVMSILGHLRIISRDYLPEGTPALTLVSIRRTLAYHFYTSGHSVQMIAKELGIEESTVTNNIKHLLEGKAI
jgi:hypothetical protein